MNNNAEELHRGPGDFILFALAFVGFVLGLSGLITGSIPVAVTGLILMLVSVCSFIVKGALR